MRGNQHDRRRIAPANLVQGLSAIPCRVGPQATIPLTDASRKHVAQLVEPPRHARPQRAAHRREIRIEEGCHHSFSVMQAPSRRIAGQFRLTEARMCNTRSGQAR